MGFSRQESWSGVPFLSPGDLPDPGTDPRVCVSCAGRQVLSQLLPLVPAQRALLVNSRGRGEHTEGPFSSLVVT